MSEMAKLLRLLVQGDKEAEVTSFPVYGDPTLFETQVTAFRKHLDVLRMSGPGSGEVYYGFNTDLSPANGMVIPSGEVHPIPVSTDISLYFCVTSGEIGNLRIREIA